MDQYELADQYINRVREDFRPHMVQGTGVLSLALIRACEDLVKVRNEFEKYKASILRERKERLAEVLGIDVDLIDEIFKEAIEKHSQAIAKPQDRAGAEHPPVSTDPQGTPVPRQHGHASLDADAFADLLDSVPPPLIQSPVRCPNCGEWAEWTLTSSGEYQKKYIYCTHCDYEEVR